MKQIKSILVIVFLLLALTGCSTQPTKKSEIPAEPTSFVVEDPYEDFNRAMFRFNLAVHETVGKPIARAYNSLPSPVKTGAHNFFTNLGVPLTVVHDLLQGKVEKAATDFMRFSINTVFGLGGLLDIASEAGMTYQPEDLGQTLYIWGVWEQTSYLMLPILGPYTTREAAGAAVDAAADPVYTTLLETNGDTRAALYVLEGVDTYSNNVQLIDQLKDQPDPYLFVREAYLQHRMNLLYDGNPPVPEVDDIDLDDF